ncbi:MAG: V-type ATPase subunit [Anaerolineales bacterium]|jgi:vacuolar-type H+-ATPase subunit C/Vma6
MSGYDYGNARLHAMKSRLLSRSEIEELVALDNLQVLIAALTKTAYRKSIGVALAHTSGMSCIAEALRNDLINTLGKIRKFYQGQAGEMVTVMLRRYDIKNLKAILRGMGKSVPAGEILASLLPIGELEYGTLTELARAPGPRAFIDLLASMGLPFAQPLLLLRSERPEVSTHEMELVLDQWYFQEAFQTCQHVRGGGSVLLFSLQLEADLTNLLTVLRFAHAPAERKVLKDWFDTGDLEGLFVGPGKLSFSLLADAGSQDTIESAIKILTETPYKAALNAGLQAYAQAARLSDFEKQLNRFRLNWMSRQFVNDPLGIGVFLGYLYLKVNEVSNIRWIAQAIQLEIKTNTIRSEMVFVS